MGQLRSRDFETAPLTVGVATALCNKSPLHAAQASGWWRAKLGIEEREDSDGMALGRIAHDACLFGLSSFEVFDGDRRTKAGKEEYQTIVSEGRTPIKPYDMRKLESIVEAFHNTIPWPFVAGDCEQDLVWTEADRYGRDVPCFGRADIVLAMRDTPIIVDLKTTRDANPDRMMSKHVEYGYDIQAHAYASALKHNGVEGAEFYFVFVETEAPFATSIVSYDALSRKLGELRWEHAKARWGNCNQFGKTIGAEAFPGYGRRTLTAPKWAIEQAMMLDREEEL